MTRLSTPRSLKPISEINMTPLIDLTFLLLITFIITFPLMEQGISVQLPKARAGDLQADRARTVTVDREERLYLDDMPLAADALEARLRELQAADPDAVVMVRADERVPYAAVVRVLKIMHRTGVTRMALVTQEE
jgi:biopolymer transport protein ExbD